LLPIPVMMGVFNDLAFFQTDNVFGNQVTAGKIIRLPT